MTSFRLRQKYLNFFVKRGHKIISPAPLIPKDDPTTLFTSSGMQQLIPFLKGEPHPLGKRLTDSQPSLRLGDIDEVGDTSHTTFFEMLGNWSLGDYFKEEQLSWFFEFLTKELGLPKEKLWISVFAGTKEIPKDEESFLIWQKLGIPREHIFFYGVEKNWWSRSGTPQEMPIGEIGGPDSEVFYDFGKEQDFHEKSIYRNQKCHPNCQCGRFLEIGNSVFIQYEKQKDGSLTELPQKNVDFGGGLERLVAATNNNPDIFEIDLFKPIIERIEEISRKSYLEEKNKRSMRIIADHLRAAVFLLLSGVRPTNVTQGYILRRLIRRAIRYGRLLGLTSHFSAKIAEVVLKINKNLKIREDEEKTIKNELEEEEIRFGKTLNRGLKEWEKFLSDFKGGEIIPGEKAFYLYESFGFPFELTVELAKERGFKIDEEGFKKAFNQHQQLSRTASVGMFKGGLADHSEEVKRLHTATHLLHAALRQVLGEHVQQKGSNITAERLRFDFSHYQKLTKEELEKIEKLVNEQIEKNLQVSKKVMSLDEAKKSGALGFFEEKYGEKVSVYSIGSFSREICAGPHVDFTGILGRFKIIKEESLGRGIRRIYAITIFK